MKLVYIIVLAALGFAIGSLAHVFVGYLFAAGGAYLGWKMGAAGNARRATLVAKAAAENERLPAYKGAYRDLDIVGESFSQDAIEKFWTGSDVTLDAVLIPENDNPHDRMAVRVEIEGAQVGHLSRETARQYRGYMGEQRCRVPVHLVKGKHDGAIGVFTGKGKADKESGPVPEIELAGTPSNMMSLRFGEIDAEQLAHCRSGDRINLWLSPDQSFVNAYRRGSVGGQGRVATLYCKDNPRLLDVMTKGRPAWLTVERHTDSTYAVDLHTTTAEEVRTREREAEDQRGKELLTPYRPKKPIVVEMRAPEAVSFQEGQQLTFKSESIDHYATSPSANLEFIVAPGLPLAFVRAGAGQRTRILRAHFSGFTIHAQVSKVSPEPVYAGDADSIWKEASATVQISFTK